MSVHPATYCPVLIGREEEVELLAAYARRRRATLIAGDAGVGKSRLAAEAVRVAAALGWSRLVGECRPEPMAPFAPFVTALRRRTRAMGKEALEALFDGPARLAAALLPEVAPLATLPAESGRQEDLFAAVWHALKRLGAPDGALLLLEDLHWADNDTLRLFAYLLRETEDLGIWVVGTYRSDELYRRHPLAPVLAELARDRAYEELRLQPLGLGELRAMVSAIFDGAQVGDEFASALLERTGGNAFFVEELMKVLLERGDVYREGGEWARRDLAEIELPWTVRETLLARARSLTEGQLELLKLAALAGDPLDIGVLARAAGVATPAVEEAIERGLQLQLLVGGREGSFVIYRFRHALTREAFADELVGPERQRAHQRLADAIADAHKADVASFSADLARHYAEANQAEKAIEFGQMAARAAMASYALEEAGRHYEAVLKLVPPSAGSRLELLVEAAEGLREGPDTRLAASFASEARDLARARSQPIAAARALTVLSYLAWWNGDSEEALALSREAAALIHGHDDREEAAVLGRLARLLVLSDRGEEARSLLGPASVLAERSGNQLALSYLHGTHVLMASHGPEFDAATQAAIGAARAANSPYAEYNVLVGAGYSCIWRGYFEPARRWLLRAVELAERILPHQRYAQAGLAWLLSLVGEYAAALERADQVRPTGRVPERIVALTARYEVAEGRGDASGALVAGELWALARKTGESQRSVPAAAARARSLLVNEGVEAALPAFWEAMGATRPMGRGPGSHWLFSPDLARGLFEAGREDELARWAVAVDELTTADQTPHNEAAGTLTRAFLLAARGAVGPARDGFAQAASLYGALPCPARQAEALLGASELEWRQGEAEAAAGAARRALEVARGIGAGALVERAERALARAEAPAVLVTVLFTDIVGSTELLSELGDRAFSSLLERHNLLVRKELERFGGREVDTAGDGFLASFSSPAQGIRCALAVRGSLAEAGIEVRAGLHTGECQQLGEKLSGLAVHVAARVSALARPGEVLVSQTVRDLALGAGLSFSPRGQHCLKGVPGEWALFAVGRAS